MLTSAKTDPYTVLAEVYDEVMANVDYELWADFIDEVIQINHPNATEVLELACGTGLFSFELEKLGYNITPTDKSLKMLEKARENVRHFDSNLQFEQADFLNINLSRRFDIVLSVFDSVNYLMDEASLLRMFSKVKQTLKPDGLFIFDFTTPLNSLESIHFLDERSGSTENGYQYFRKSRYDEKLQVHYNTFEIERFDNQGNVIEHFTEIHEQRAYKLSQMTKIIRETNFTVKAAYGEFNMKKANAGSHRITIVLK